MCRSNRRSVLSSPSLLAEVLRVGFGTRPSLGQSVYGRAAVIFIIFLPRASWQHHRKAEGATQA